MGQTGGIQMSAEDAYSAEHLKARDLLESIGELLDDIPAPSDESRLNWGHVGDLKEVTRRLESVAAFLNHTEV